MRLDDRRELRPWRRLATRDLFVHERLRVREESVQLPDERVVEGFLTVEAGEYATIFVSDEDGRVLTLWHYKHGAERVTLDLPAGHLEPGEEPLAAARRELLEEMGLVCDTWRPLGSFVVSGNRGMGRHHVFLAEGVRAVREPTGDGDLEDFALEWMPPSKLQGHLLGGDVATQGGALAMALGLVARGTADYK